MLLLSHESPKTKRAQHTKEKSFGSSALLPPGKIRRFPRLSYKRVGFIGICFCRCFIYNTRPGRCQILFAKAYHLKLLLASPFVTTKGYSFSSLFPSGG